MRRALGLVLIGAALLAAGCVRTGVHDFDGFESAVEKGQPCSELFELRAGMDKDLNKADALLRQIGCTSSTATRTDR